jgi:type II secretory pathway predicted ATPase ExeA
VFQDYYGCARAPFSKTIETDKLFATAGQKDLTARLTYLVRERGYGLVTGAIGSGKSTAVRAFTAGLDANSYLGIYLANPTTGSIGLYRELLLTLGHEPPCTKPCMVSHIRSARADLRPNKRRTPLVLVDEAHLLTQAMLEEWPPAVQRHDAQ